MIGVKQNWPRQGWAGQVLATCVDELHSFPKPIPTPIRPRNLPPTFIGLPGHLDNARLQWGVSEPSEEKVKCNQLLTRDQLRLIST